jgi:hypothetical protein
MLSPLHSRVFFKEGQCSSPVPVLLHPLLFSDTNWSPLSFFIPHYGQNIIAVLRPKCNSFDAGCLMASEDLGRCLGGCRISTLLQWQTQGAPEPGWPPGLPQLAVRACVFVHTNISLPLIIHLVNFKAASSASLTSWVFITFISCISLARLASDVSFQHC